jgi:4a-hydroxytetrahydrobiopterin dehydratase
MAVLSDQDVDAALSGLAGWERNDKALRRSVKFPSFLEGIEAVRRIADRAEAADHHPDIDIRWRTVTFVLSTHSEGGITQKDLALAKEIDEIAQ